MPQVKHGERTSLRGKSTWLVINTLYNGSQMAVPLRRQGRTLRCTNSQLRPVLFHILFCSVRIAFHHFTISRVFCWHFASHLCDITTTGQVFILPLSRADPGNPLPRLDRDTFFK